MGQPLIESILSLTLTTVEGRVPAVGSNKAAFVSSDADASLDGKLYVDAAEVDADVTATDLTAQAGVQIKAILAAGPRVGGVRLMAYDGAGGEDPDDALAANATAGFLPMWDYFHIVIQDRVDADIANAATWLNSNYAGRAIVWGQLSTASIVSGTVPAGVAASAGDDRALVYYHETDTVAGVERIVGMLCAWPISRSRPAFGIMQPSGMPSSQAVDLTKAQIALVTGRDSGQARCLASKELYPSGSINVIAGYTIGGTLGEVEYGELYFTSRIYQQVAVLIESRGTLQQPLRTTDGDAAAIRGVIEAVAEELANGGYIERGVGADIATGRPSLPDGYDITVTFSGTTANVRGWVAYPGDVRAISIDLTGFVT